MVKQAFYMDPVMGPTVVGPGGELGSPIRTQAAGYAANPPAMLFDPDTGSIHPMPTPGRKDDSGKLDVTLFFDDLPHAIEAVAEVLQWAVTKKKPEPYRRGSWQGVDPFQPRYRAAQLRHMLDAAKEAKMLGVKPEFTRDIETGLLQLAHNATDAMFQLEMAVRELKRLKAKAEQEVS